MVVLHPLIFDTASHCVFIIRVVECGLDKRTIRWVANGLCHQAEGGVTSTAQSSAVARNWTHPSDQRWDQYRFLSPLLGCLVGLGAFSAVTRPAERYTGGQAAVQKDLERLETGLKFGIYRLGAFPQVASLHVIPKDPAQMFKHLSLKAVTFLCA